jgi:deoxyribodipyrimidine photo-lyase
VFDEPLLARIRVSAKRLVFIAETLAELAERREVRVMVGDPVAELSGGALASTFAPVPGYQTRAAGLRLVAVHPYPWTRRPNGGDVRSHSVWIKAKSPRR